MQDADMISFEQVTKHYDPAAPVLKGITLRIKAGEFVSLVGVSGTGKTTLVKMLIAEEKPTRGSIKVGGWDITGLRGNEVPGLRRQIGVVFQDFKLLRHKTVFENVAFALEVCNSPSEKIKSIVPQVLKIVGLDGKADRYPRQLSGGEQQRTVIARALVHQPKILVADEPTGNLDTHNTREIVELLERINRYGTTVLLVTHNREVVNMLRRRVVTMQDGLISNDQEVGKYAL